MRKAEIGAHVIYHDPVGRPHDALLTTIWSSDEHPLVNLVLVSSDEARQDSYGRQIERQTSCNHASKMPVHGNYWRFPDEEPNPFVAPVAK